MIYRIEVRNGAISKSAFVEASGKDGASVFYVDAESEAKACEEALRRYAAKRAIGKNVRARKISQGVCGSGRRGCLGIVATGHSMCSFCLEKTNESSNRIIARKKALGLRRTDRLPESAKLPRAPVDRFGLNASGVGGQRLRYRLETLKDIRGQYAVDHDGKQWRWLNAEIRRCQSEAAAAIAASPLRATAAE